MVAVRLRHKPFFSVSIYTDGLVVPTTFLVTKLLLELEPATATI